MYLSKGRKQKTKYTYNPKCLLAKKTPSALILFYYDVVHATNIHTLLIWQHLCGYKVTAAAAADIATTKMMMMSMMIMLKKSSTVDAEQDDDYDEIRVDEEILLLAFSWNN